MNYAILDTNNVVLNIILASDAFCQMAYPGRWVKLTAGLWCDIGATYNPITKAFAPSP